MAESSQSVEVRRLYSGLIRLHVLYHADRESIIGFGIMQELRRHGYRIGPGTIYPMLHAMERSGLLRSKQLKTNGRAQRAYRITPSGRKALIAAKKKVHELFHELFEEESLRARRRCDELPRSLEGAYSSGIQGLKTYPRSERMNSARTSFWGHAGSIVLIVLSIVFTAAARGQGASAPIKQGLWQTQVTSTMQMALPPEVEARIAAMPAAQQAQVRSMMGGTAPKPASSTVKSCVASPTTPNDLLNQAQQKAGMKCTFSNQQQTANSISFDISCTTAQGSASGHAEFTMADSDHGTGTTHMTIAMTSNGHAMNATMDGKSTYTFLGADCGDVKPDAPVVTTGQ